MTLLLVGCVVVLLGGPDHGVNGFSILGIVLGVIGLGTIAGDL